MKLMNIVTKLSTHFDWNLESGYLKSWCSGICMKFRRLRSKNLESEENLDFSEIDASERASTKVCNCYVITQGYRNAQHLGMYKNTWLQKGDTWRRKIAIKFVQINLVTVLMNIVSIKEQLKVDRLTSSIIEFWLQ